MYRSLATRLTATYVFAAIVLVVIVIAAVTAFALSMFGIGARASSREVVRQVPEEVRLEIAHAGSFARAAPDIARHLVRPGLRVIVFAGTGDRRRFLAAADADADGRSNVHVAEPPGAARRGGLDAGGPGGPGGPGRPRGRMDAFPFGLNMLLKLQPLDVDVPGGRIGIMPDPSPLARTIDAFWLAMLPIGAFAIVAAWLLGRYITGQALRPLVETTAALNRFAQGDFTPRPIATAERNEIGELVAAYNGAVAQVAAAFEERRNAETHMRQFIADAGHELRTPLTVIMGFIDVLRRRAQNEPAMTTRIHDTMLAESRRMKALIDKLIVLARLENTRERELETVDLGEVASQVVAALQVLEPSPRIALDVQAGALVRGYENELHDAISNLVENAIKYAPGAPVEVRVGREAQTCVVEVADRGPGIDAIDREHVFDRFYRGRDRVEREGFGLGLAIAKRAVERVGGTIALESAAGDGSRFTIRLPTAPLREAVVAG